MTREELKNKLFDIILKNSSPTMVVERTIDYRQTMAIVEELIKHEQDTLKEFVEYVQNYDSDYIIDTHEDIRRHYKPPIHISISEVLENFIKE